MDANNTPPEDHGRGFSANLISELPGADHHRYSAVRERGGGRSGHGAFGVEGKGSLAMLSRLVDGRMQPS